MKNLLFIFSFISFISISNAQGFNDFQKISVTKGDITLNIASENNSINASDSIIYVQGTNFILEAKKGNRRLNIRIEGDGCDLYRAREYGRKRYVIAEYPKCSSFTIYVKESWMSKEKTSFIVQLLGN